MIYKKDKIILGAIFLGLLLIIFFSLEKTLSFPDQAWPLEKGEKIKISSEIIQKFEAGSDGLTRIKMLFGDSDVSPGGTFKLKILDENCQTSIREIKLKITSLSSENTTDFIFPRIKDSNGKTFCLNLSYAPQKGGKKANIFTNANTLPQNKFLSMNGAELTGQSIAMRPAYRNQYLWQDLSQLNQEMSQYKPWFLKHYYLDFVVLFFLFGTVILVVFLVI